MDLNHLLWPLLYHSAVKDVCWILSTCYGCLLDLMMRSSFTCDGCLLDLITCYGCFLDLMMGSSFTGYGCLLDLIHMLRMFAGSEPPVASFCWSSFGHCWLLLGLPIEATHVEAAWLLAGTSVLVAFVTLHFSFQSDFWTWEWIANLASLQLVCVARSCPRRILAPM